MSANGSRNEDAATSKSKSRANGTLEKKVTDDYKEPEYTGFSLLTYTVMFVLL